MQSVIYKTFNDVMSGKPATLFKSHNPKYEDGGQLRDFIWIDDCVSVVLWFLENPKSYLSACNFNSLPVYAAGTG